MQSSRSPTLPYAASHRRLSPFNESAFRARERRAAASRDETKLNRPNCLWNAPV